MSRIRVYDLAKEADMPSKELAEKLIALGYNIKSHSSSVEDDVADEIRRKVIGTAETEVVEKRISTKWRTTVIRRRSQTVRRAPEQHPVEEEVPEETIETEKEADEEKPAPKKVRKKAAKKKKETTEPKKLPPLTLLKKRRPSPRLNLKKSLLKLNRKKRSKRSLKRLKKRARNQNPK